LEIGREFPNIDAAVLVGGDDLECQEMARGIKSLTTRVPTIGIRCEGTDYSVPSFEPEELVRLLRELLGDPRQIDAA
jgi:hypothetical protein